ncbi:hypothetical protein Tco_0385237 [Tanacetum coccineum]
MTAEHSSLSLTDEAAFSSFSLCERRSFRTLAPLGMWIIASRKGREGYVDDLEGWYKVGDCEVTPPEFARVSLPSGLSTSVILWVTDGAGADRSWKRLQASLMGSLFSWRNRRILSRMNVVHSGGKNLFSNWETNCSHVVTRPGGSLSSHSFALPFRVKRKNRNRDASFVAPSAWRTIGFWNPDGFGQECSYKLLGVGAVFGSILTNDDASFSKRFVERFCQSPNGATSHGGGFDEQGERRENFDEGFIMTAKFRRRHNFPDVVASRSRRRTDIAKITRKRSKPDKHGHGNGIECAKAGRMLSWSTVHGSIIQASKDNMAELYVTKASHWWKPTRRDMVALKEAHGEMDFCTKRLTKEAQVTIPKASNKLSSAL